MAVAGGHDAEEVEEGLQLLRREGELAQEDEDIDEDQRPRDDGACRLGIVSRSGIMEVCGG
jgi:hypothetical protein